MLLICGQSNIKHLLELMVVLEGCVTGLDIAKKSRVIIFIMPYCGCRSLTWLQERNGQ
jgi:hypothetical protein